MRTQHGMGVYAPSIRYHSGEFYIYWGDPDRGIFMVKTKDPAGEWEKPVMVVEGLDVYKRQTYGLPASPFRIKIPSSKAY